MLWLYPEFQPQDGGLQLVLAGHDRLVLPHQPRLGRLAVDVPGEVNGGFGPAGGAIYADSVPELVARLTARYVRVLVGENCGKNIKI